MENTNTELNAEQQQLAALLEELNLDDEIIEPAEPSVTTDELGQVSLSDAVAELEREEQLEALYAEADAQKAAEAAQKTQEELFDPSAGIDPTLLLGTPVEEAVKPTKKAAKPKVKAEPKVKQKKEAAKPEVKTEEQQPQPEVKPEAVRSISELTVGSAFAQSQFIRDELALTPSKTRVVYGNHFEFVDGKVVAFDKPAGAANRTPLVDAQGEPLAFEAALKKIVDADPDRDQLLRSKMKQGAASTTDPKATKPSSVKDAPQVKGITEASIRKRNSDVTQEMRDKQALSDANNFYADNKLEVEALQDSLLSQTEQRKRYWDREIKRSQERAST